MQQAIKKSFIHNAIEITAYVSGIAGFLFLILRATGILLNFEFNDFLLVSGLVLLFAVCLPLTLVNKFLNDKKMDEFLKNTSSHTGKAGSETGEESKSKGWGMNDSPYRKRKQGLTWGGGNIKAANAKRGDRRTFLN